MPDDHSKLVPLLPIPNRTVKRLCADDSAGSRVKVGHRQALTAQTALLLNRVEGRFALGHLGPRSYTFCPNLLPARQPSALDEQQQLPIAEGLALLVGSARLVSLLSPSRYRMAAQRDLREKSVFS